MEVCNSVFFWTVLSLELLASDKLIVASDVVYVTPKDSQAERVDSPVERVARSADVDDSDGLHMHSRLYNKINATEVGLAKLKKIAESNEDSQKFYLSEDLDHVTAHIEENLAKILPVTAESLFHWGFNASTNLTVLESHDKKVFHTKLRLRFLRYAVESLERGIRRIGENQGFCSVKYHERCYWLEVREGEKIGCDEIKGICSVGGGEPASVYSELHYNELVRFIRSVVVNKHWSPRDSYLDSWIASSYHPRTKNVVFPYDRRAAYVKWMPGHPRNDACCCMAIKVSSQWDAVYQGMFNAPHGHQAKSVICEKL